mgnify:CR=1 FL=1
MPIADDTRERLIAEYKRRMLASFTQEKQRYWQGKMFTLIRGRSRAQVDRMEREHGLADTRRLLGPWIIR